MEIRLILKTHYQINKPGIFSILLRKCTSPNQSNYPETISNKLSSIHFESISLNKESAKFAVAMAQSFGFITKNMFWNWKGHSINLLLDETNREKPDDFLKLTPIENLLYLKYYLEADGATILEICKRLYSKGSISRIELLSSDFIDQIFIDIWGSYRQLTDDLREKTSLRQSIDKLRSKPYTFKTRIHKALAHIEPLVDFNFIDRKEEKKEVFFIPKVTNGVSAIERLSREINNIEDMEARFSRYEFFEIINNVYNMNSISYDPEIHLDLLRGEIVKSYLQARTEPSNMASIATISDIISVRMLQERGILIDRPQVENELNKLKYAFNRDVRYHLDMSGKRAFIILSDRLCKISSLSTNSDIG